MKISDTIDRPCVIMTRFTSYQLYFLEPLFRLFTQGCRIAMLERMQLVIAWLYNSLNDVGYDVDPILVVICVKTLDDYVFSKRRPCSVSGAIGFPSEAWTEECIIFSKQTLEAETHQTPLSPLVALGWFFTSQALSIFNAPFSNDQTMKYLYNLALQPEENRSKNTVLSLLEAQNKEYQKLLELATTANTDQLIKEIKNAKEQTDLLKETISSDKDDYEKGMEFVQQYKEARERRGLTRMDWVKCLEEGAKLGLLSYKNSNTLRNQYNKFAKQREE